MDREILVGGDEDAILSLSQIPDEPVGSAGQIGPADLSDIVSQLSERGGRRTRDVFVEQDFHAGVGAISSGVICSSASAAP